MRVLLDQGTPAPIRRSLEGHEVRTSREQGWSRFANGELLKAAEDAGFDVLLTTDQNMRYQQNLKGRKIAIVFLGKVTHLLREGLNWDIWASPSRNTRWRPIKLHGSGNPRPRVSRISFLFLSLAIDFW